LIDHPAEGGMAPILVLDPAIEPAGPVGTVTMLREALQVQQGVLE